jgi:hypothetical protein
MVPLIASGLTKDQLCQPHWEVNLSYQRIDAAISQLRRRGTVRHLGGGYWWVRQRECAGACGRRGETFKGEAVYVDPETLRWFCWDCWESEGNRVQALVIGD